MIDALASEAHFVDHLAPIWAALPLELRGRFVTPPALAGRARSHGIESVASPDRRAPRLLVASYGDVLRGRRGGWSRFAFVEHGIGQSYAGRPGEAARHHSYAGGEDRRDHELFLVPNEICAARWRAAYPSATVLVVGSPHAEALPAREPGPGPVIAVSFHWAGSVAQEAGMTWPHWRGILPKLPGAYPAGVLGHGHPRIFEGLRAWYRRWGIEPVADFRDVCRRADLYVVDNSSTLYEFASTGRPVVVLNGPAYRRSVDHGLRFWEAADVGIQVDQPGQLLDAVALALEDLDSVRRAREAALSLVYSVRGGAAGIAAAGIAEWMRVGSDDGRGAPRVHS